MQKLTRRRFNCFLAGLPNLAIAGRHLAVPAAEAAAAKPSRAPEGPFEPTWESIRAHYTTPDWFRDGKFGIFRHWGIYSVPAHHGKWYVRYMYGQGADRQWHTEHFGPIDKFGYKDFIPMFTAEKWDPNAWAELFRRAGAKYIVPTAEHHDGFSLWDSALNKYNAKNMGPRRDLIGDLARAVRARGPEIRCLESQHGAFQLRADRRQQRPDASAMGAVLQHSRPQPRGAGEVSGTVGKQEPGTDRQVSA